MVERLVATLLTYPEVGQLVVTCNIPESLTLPNDARILLIANRRSVGFGANHILYYEDVDICARAWKAGMKVAACPGVAVLHDARRDSHRNPRYLRWHLASMIRYFLKHWGRLPEVPNA